MSNTPQRQPAQEPTAERRGNKFPTRLHCICSRCGHQGSANIFLDQVSKLKCKACGCRDVVVAGRDNASRSWSRRRLGK